MTAAVVAPGTQPSRPRGKRFLVIGATGHVGPKVTGRLGEGYDVRRFDLPTPTAGWDADADGHAGPSIQPPPASKIHVAKKEHAS